MQDMLLSQPGQFSYYKYGLNKNEQKQEEKNMVPMEIILIQIINVITQEQKRRKIYLLSAGTGAGKSSYFVVELLKRCGSKGMICTKPKQQLVIDPMIDLPKYYPEMIKGYNMGFKVGGGVGIQPIQKQCVIFMTTQILTNMIIEEQWEELFQYKFIAIDEVHEMNEQMIQVLYFIKIFTLKFIDDPQCPVFICMSATIDIPKFLRYFEMDSDLQWYDVGQLKSQKMRFERKMLYFHQSQNYIVERIEESFQYIDKLYIKEKIWEKTYKDIVIFCKNSAGIRLIQDYLRQRKFEYKTKIFSFMQSDNAKRTQNYVDFYAEFPGVIKIILSTNMLESGVNIPGLYVVIDTGIRFTSIYNNIQQKASLVSIPISQQSVIQRMGRVGRSSEGIFIGLYKKDRKFSDMDLNPLLTSNNIFNSVFLYLKYQLQDIKSVQDFLIQKPSINVQDIDLIENLSGDIIIRSYHQLLRFGLIQRSGKINISMFILSKDDYMGFVRFVCEFYGCDPFETLVIQFMNQRPFKAKGAPLQYQLEMIVKKDYSIFDIDEIIIMYDFISQTLLKQKFYYKIPYNPEGYKMALWVLR